MKKLFMLALLFGIIQPSLGQNPFADSLQNQIQHPSSEENQLQAYWELTRHIAMFNQEEALEISKQHFRAARQANNKSHMVYAKGSQAMIHMNSKQLDEAKIDLDSALEIAGNDTNAGLDILHNYYGIVYTSTGNYELALEHYLKARDIYIATNSGDYTLAILYGGIGNTHIELKNYVKAKEYYRKALAMLEPIDHYEMGSILGNLAEAMEGNNEPYDSIMVYLHAGLKENRLAYDTIGMFLTAVNIMSTSLEHGEVDIAKRAGALADTIRSAIPEDPDLVYHYVVTNAKLQCALGNYDSGIKMAQSIIDLSKNDSTAGKDFIAALDVLRKAYREKGDLKRYEKLTEQYIEVKDSIYQVDIAASIVELEQRYKTARQERMLIEQQCAIQDQEAQLLIAEKDQKVQRNYIVGLGVGLVLLLITGGVVVNRQRILASKNKIEKDLVNAKLQNTQLEKQQLMDQLEHQERELASYALSLVRKNELLSQLQEKVSAMDQVNKDIKSISGMIRSNIAQDGEWEEFNLRFNKVHPGFYDKLSEKFPELTPNEVRICALMRLNLNSREIGNLININTRSVDQNKYRLKKKLGLGADVGLQDFIRAF